MFYIEELTITLDNKTQKFENLIIEYQPDRITKTIYLDQIIEWKPNSKIKIDIFMHGTRFYMFFSGRNNPTYALFDLEGNNFIEDSQCLGLPLYIRILLISGSNK